MLFGVVGAVLSTVVIALPAFIIIPLHKLYDRVRSNRFIANFVIGITATSIGLIFGAVYDMGVITLTGAVPWIVFISTIVLSRIIKKNTFMCFVIASTLGIILMILFESLHL
jgi:chromate transport protein ChrA